MAYVRPSEAEKAFTCPHCGAYAQQDHINATARLQLTDGPNVIHSSFCRHCSGVCLWYNRNLVYPVFGQSPLPNPQMPEDVKQDYQEAANICAQSPRGACALLRLAIQKLCVELGGKCKNLNSDIALLVENGLPTRIQKALDIVRVIGNNAVHPGQIDTDDPKMVADLFLLTNLIVEQMIEIPGKVNSLFSSLPDGAKEAIERRDG